MNKELLNKYCRKFGFEIHGTGFIQSAQKTSFKEDAFAVQKALLGNKCSIIFDIGANRGQVTAKYIALFPAAKVYAFEPFPASIEIFKEKFGGNGKVFSFQKAIGEKPGNRKFFVNRNVDTNSLLKPQKMGLSSDGQVDNVSTMEVDVWTIEDFCSNNSIDHIDILKMDIQGGELDALKGATGLLKDKKIKLIYSETYFKKQYEDQPLFHDISTYLEEYGYELKDLYNPIYGKGSLAWCDVIFLPRNE